MVRPADLIMHTANQLARRMRDERYRAPRPGESPPAYLTVPVNIARKAIAVYREQGAEAARAYAEGSVLSRWANHSNPSMRTGAQHVLMGIDGYIEADEADGREALSLTQESVLSWPAGPLAVRIDVALAEPAGVSARAVFWDGVEIDREDAELIAAPYLEAMRQLYPEREIASIGIWHGRYQRRFEVPAEIADRRLERAKIIHRGL